MPQLVDTISTYFFKKQRDLYFVRFNDVKRGVFDAPEGDFDWQKIPGRQELLDWLSENMPEIEVGKIFLYKDDDGILQMPYDGSIYIDFTPEALAKFDARWEDAEGKCVDSRWQCYWYPLEQYKEEYDGRIPDPKEFWDF